MKFCANCRLVYPDELQFCSEDALLLSPLLIGTEVQVAEIAKRFRILQLLGAGGMGRVFRAEQLTVGNRPVALKVLTQPNNPDDYHEFLARFREEAAKAGSINHSNVVTIYDSSQFGDGIPYIAMEYLRGQSLRDALKDGPLAEAQCAEILQQAADGLDAAHTLGIIHRDLKPDNLFLTSDNRGQLKVKVLDFGIAKMRESTTLTRPGEFLGSPAYTSPEQASGMKGEELDHRADIYSLGVVAYEMLTGRVPFQDTFVGCLIKHQTEPPPPFSAAAPGVSILPQVEAIVMKALAKDRDKRHQKVLEFASAFARAARQGRSVEISTASASPKGVRPRYTDRFLKICPKCDHRYPQSVNRCSYDGSSLEWTERWTEGCLINGRFRLLTKLDEDDVCQVFWARQLEAEFFRSLAVLRWQGFWSHEWLERLALTFKHEAFEWMKIKHPNVAGVDVDEDDDGRPFMVMEAGDGEYLETIIRREAPFPPLRACAIAKQIAAGLEAIHARGGVHGGVAPRSVFLFQDAGGETAKLMPLGLYKLQKARLPPDNERCDLRNEYIQIYYSSPEQIRSDPGLDGRSDLYRLGVVLYELLTRDVPLFQARDFVLPPLQVHDFEKMLAAKYNKPQKPIVLANPELKIPEPLADLIMRLLDEKREMRPATARDVIDEIAHIEQFLR